MFNSEDTFVLVTNFNDDHNVYISLTDLDKCSFLRPIETEYRITICEFHQDPQFYEVSNNICCPLRCLAYDIAFPAIRSHQCSK